jgi:hypothetical protein
MTPGGPPAHGELFERRYDVAGAVVELLAEVEVAGPVIHLKDVAVFPTGASSASVGAAAVLRVLRRELLSELAALGYTTVRITGTRLSGASRGRSLDLTISIPEELS